MSDSENRASIPHRPTVRIVEHRINWRGAIATLAVTATAAALVLMLWRLWRPEDSTVPYQRTLADVEMDWECDAGHGFVASGLVGPRPCATCKQPAYPVVKYVCELHGTVDVMARFGGDKPGSEQLTQLRVAGRDWVSADKPPVCSRCNKELRRHRPETFVSSSKPKEKAGGG